MKTSGILLSIAIAVAMAATGCRSNRSAVDNAQTTPVERVETGKWKNLYVPVTMDIIKPMEFSCSGRATMVNGESIYLSMRMFGMEVGSFYATPDEAVLAMRAPSKVAVEMPIFDRLQQSGLTFSDIQEALLGNEHALAKLKNFNSVSFTSDVTDTRSTIEIQTVAQGKPVAVRLTWNLKDAEWNLESPRQWTAPGSDYKRLTPAQAAAMLKGR